MYRYYMVPKGNMYIDTYVLLASIFIVKLHVYFQAIFIPLFYSCVYYDLRSYMAIYIAIYSDFTIICQLSPKAVNSLLYVFYGLVNYLYD